MIVIVLDREAASKALSLLYDGVRGLQGGNEVRRL